MLYYVCNKSNVCGINKPPVNRLVVLGVLIQQYDEIGDGKYCNSERLFVVGQLALQHKPCHSIVKWRFNVTLKDLLNQKQSGALPSYHARNEHHTRRANLHTTMSIPLCNIIIFAISCDTQVRCFKSRHFTSEIICS